MNLQDSQAQRLRALAYGLTGVALLAGIYVRLRGLGQWPLAEDEFFMALSVEHILQSGVPAPDCDGYPYLRGVLYQYLVVPLLATGMSSELALRAVSVPANLLAIPALMMLGRRCGGAAVAMTVAALFALSLWEIEFARFGRMYAPFQALFVWHLLYLHRAAIDGQRRDFHIMLALSLAAAATWEGGIFLAVLNFVPAALRGGVRGLRPWLEGSAVLALAGAWLAVKFIRAGTSVPPDVALAPPVEKGLLTPVVLAQALANDPVWALASLVPLALCVRAMWRLARRDTLDVRGRVVLAALVVLAAANQLALVVYTSLLGLLLGWLHPRALRLTAGRAIALAVAVTAGFWIVFAFSSEAWHALLPAFDPQAMPRKVAVVLLKYPNVFDSVIFSWMEALPLLSAITAGAFVAATALALRSDDREAKALRVLLIVILSSVLMVGAIGTPYRTTRYTFFLLPVVYLVIALVVSRAAGLVSAPRSRAAVFGLAVAAIMIAAEDFELRHLLDLNTAQYNYRQAVAVPDHYYLREDYRSPANYVNTRAQPADTVVTSLLPSSHYLARTDYVYRHHATGEFPAISCDKGTREKWTGLPLIYAPDALVALTAQSGADVWLLLGADARQPESLNYPIHARFADAIVYSGADGAVDVYRISGSASTGDSGSRPR